MKRKILSVVCSVLALFSLSACTLTEGVKDFFSNLIGEEEGVAGGYHFEAQETRVVIIPNSQVGTTHLIDFMETIRLNGGFRFEENNEMITSINGKENAADFSSCWMLYTSDTEFSNTDWGTVEYDGKTLGSAIVGAEALPIKTGEIYLWEYCTF